MSNKQPAVTSMGRPMEVDKVSRRYVTLDDATVKVLKGLGEGNLSLGIREAARRIDAERKKKRPA